MTVAEIQRALLAREYDLGLSGADGDAGPHTIAAVTAFRWPADMPLPAPHTLPTMIAGACSGVSEA